MKDHDYLKPLEAAIASEAKPDEIKALAIKLQQDILAVAQEKKDVDQKNLIRLGGSDKRNDLSQADLLSLDTNKFHLWSAMFGNKGLLYFGDAKIDRWVTGPWKAHLTALRSEVAQLKKDLPEQYPFLHGVADVEHPKNGHVLIRGTAGNLGEEVPRRFVSILSDGTPKPFPQGSGRLELASAIASPTNPLTARVMVNRIWQHHFGQGIVRTPSNFGQLGERPTHPELLDYLASRFVASGWSIKALHREIMLSSTYGLAWQDSAAQEQKDADNRWLWRANRQRLDAESLRDSLLWAGGELDPPIGGPAIKLDVDTNHRRTVYGFRSRRKMDTYLAMFDHPSANSTSEQRIETNVPLQRLYLLNNPLVIEQANALAKRLHGDTDEARIRDAYQLLYLRAPNADEVKLGLDFLHSGTWPQYAQVLLISNEFLYVN